MLYFIIWNITFTFRIYYNIQLLIVKILFILIASLKSEAISDCAQGECRTFEIVLIYVCLSVNNAVRCTLHVLSVI